jgi:hypothetical protein
MRYELKAIGVWASVKVLFFVNLSIGFVLGILYVPFMYIWLSAFAEMGMGEEFGFSPADFPIGLMLIIFPIGIAIFSAVVYTLLAVLFILLYNGVTRIFGGFEFNMETLAELRPIPSGGQPEYAQTGNIVPQSGYTTPLQPRSAEPPQTPGLIESPSNMPSGPATEERMRSDDEQFPGNTI